MDARQGVHWTDGHVRAAPDRQAHLCRGRSSCRAYCSHPGDPLDSAPSAATWDEQRCRARVGSMPGTGGTARPQRAPGVGAFLSDAAAVGTTTQPGGVRCGVGGTPCVPGDIRHQVVTRGSEDNTGRGRVAAGHRESGTVSRGRRTARSRSWSGICCGAGSSRPSPQDLGVQESRASPASTASMNAPGRGTRRGRLPSSAAVNPTEPRRSRRPGILHRRSSRADQAEAGSRFPDHRTGPGTTNGWCTLVSWDTAERDRGWPVTVRRHRPRLVSRTWLSD